ncbi:MAG: hypothetical protein CR991_11835 [Proteobacteria bacterium]|nr:MAG: hypothetical protein CR991_11835 [Pseudomonadota bacterium]
MGVAHAIRRPPLTSSIALVLRTDEAMLRLIRPHPPCQGEDTRKMIMTVTTTQTYDELAMFLGNEVADVIVGAFRGQELYVPVENKLCNEHKLVRLLGFENAKRLCHYYASQVITIPMQQAKRIAERDKEIVARYEAGVKKSTLAGEYGLHVRTIRNIVSRHYQRLADEAYQQNQLCLF